MFEIKGLIFFVLMMLSSQCPSVENACPPCECGRNPTNPNHRRGKVLGGEDTRMHEYPWVAMITFRSKLTCTGNLINSKYILTAAHCFTLSNKTSDYQVQLLRHHVNPRAEGTPIQTLGVRRIISHEHYTRILNGPKRNIYADIALAQLDRDVVVRPRTNVLAPICLPRSDLNVNGSSAILVGWGDTSTEGAAPTVLQKLRVRINNYANCHLPKFSKTSFSQVDKICASNQEGGRGSCYGDSGGPLQLRHNNRGAYHLVGMVSYGTDRCANITPIVFVKVSHFLEWISKNTKDACPCYAVNAKSG